MGQAAILALHIAAAGARSERLQPDAPKRYPTGPRHARSESPVACAARPRTEAGASLLRTSSWRRRRRRLIGHPWCGAVVDGDATAWPELVAGQQRRIYALCYRFTNSAHDAEDLTQDVFIKLYGNLRSFDAARGSFPTWITTMTRNLLVDHYRRARQQRVTDSLDAGWDQGQQAALAAPISHSLVDPRNHPAAARSAQSTTADGAERAGQSVARAARGSHSARPARYGLQRDCRGAGDSPGNRQVTDQPRPRGTGAAAGTY